MKNIRNKTDKTDLITEDEIEGALTRAGYFLEQRIKRKLNSNEFVTASNTSFSDPTTKKSREIDVEAYFEIEIFDDPQLSLFYFIVGECKNKFQPLAFIKDDVPNTFESEHDLIIAGSPTYLVNTDKNSSVPSIDFGDYVSSFGKFDWISSSKWCTFKFIEKIEKWMATGDEEDYLSIYSLIIALQQRMREHQKHTDYNKFGLFIFQPVLFLQNDFYVAEEKNGHVTLKKSNKILLSTDHSTTHEEDIFERNTYSIHVIAESELEKYIKRTKSYINDLKKSLTNKKELFVQEANRRKKE